MSELDSGALYEELDKSDMAGLVESFSDQVSRAWQIASQADLSHLYRKPKRVLFLGMGGSAIGSSLACALAERESSVPLAVHRGYELPAWVDKNTLVVAVSYSGNTLETLSTYQSALERKAPTVILTSGGKLSQLAKEKKQSVVIIPRGMPPRASLGYLFIPLLKILDSLGIYSIGDEEVESLVEALQGVAEEVGRKRAERDNSAKSLARQLHGAIPLVYGSVGVMGVAAERWCGQLQENSKVLAFYNVFPELCHNQVIGWVDRACVGERVVLVSLTDGEENPWLAKQIEVTLAMAEERKATVVEITVSGENRLEKALKAIYMGDFVSLYLAMLNRADPTETDNISRLKDAVAEVDEKRGG